MTTGHIAPGRILRSSTRDGPRFTYEDLDAEHEGASEEEGEGEESDGACGTRSFIVLDSCMC